MLCIVFKLTMKIHTQNSLFIEIHRLKLPLEGSSLTTSNKSITESTAVHKNIWILEKRNI